MEVNELRIGNWVLCDNIPRKVIELNFVEEDIEANCEDVNYLNINHYNPIPLTEEILLKCGYVENGAWYESVELKLDIFKDFQIFWIEDAEEHTEIRKPIKHLHQLQNLYFALTQEELNIEL